MSYLCDFMPLLGLYAPKNASILARDFVRRSITSGDHEDLTNKLIITREDNIYFMMHKNIGRERPQTINLKGETFEMYLDLLSSEIKETDTDIFPYDKRIHKELEKRIMVTERKIRAEPFELTIPKPLEISVLRYVQGSEYSP